MIFIRFILICVIIYLLIRSFVRFFAEEEEKLSRGGNRGRKSHKKNGVSKEIGEYVDYEEVD